MGKEQYYIILCRFIRLKRLSKNFSHWSIVNKQDK